MKGTFLVLVLPSCASSVMISTSHQVKLDDLRIVLMLPGMSSHSNILARTLCTVIKCIYWELI